MTLLVSAYYDIPSKAPHSFYLEHMKRFFRFLKGKPILFFCEEKTKKELEGFHLSLENVEFIILPFSQIVKDSKIPFEIWKESCIIDPEKYHTPELGFIWANKKEFIRLAAEYNKNIDWFIWIDAGCIRKDLCEGIYQSFLNRNMNLLNPGVYLQQINKIEPKEFYIYPDICIAGAIIVFHRNFIDIYIEEYNKTLINYYYNKIPLIMDQYIMASLVKFPWLHTIKGYEFNSIYDRWFFFLEWL